MTAGWHIDRTIVVSEGALRRLREGSEERRQMGCLLVMLGAFFPRLAVLFIWLARPAYFNQAIGSALVALIGIALVPFTTLTYVLLWTPSGLSGTDWIWIALAFGIDVITAGSSAWGNRDRMPGYPAD